MYLYNNSCVNKCPLNWGHMALNNTCVACAENCGICYSLDNIEMICGLCINQNFLLDGNCVASCPTGFIDKHISILF